MIVLRIVSIPVIFALAIAGIALAGAGLLVLMTGMGFAKTGEVLAEVLE